MSHNVGQNKKVVLITSGQPSLNPRLVKEADSLADAGFEVTVLYVYWNAWGTQYDKALLASKSWRAIRVGGDPDESPLLYLISRLIFKAAGLFTRITGAMTLASTAIARSSLFLIREAKKHRADIYIGHNLGALAATVKAAEKYGKPCGFDAEDFHRNELTDNDRSMAVKLTRYMEDRYIPRLQYLTASSPMICEMYQRLYPGIPTETILNVFSKKSAIALHERGRDRIKLFWFSQTIGVGRGIEVILDALALQNDSFELHLLGKADDEIRALFAARVSTANSKVYFYQPIPPDDIIAFAAQFDIGIAPELRTPLNRDICLTNKLFTYIQAGLAVIASNTSAQTTFMQQNGVAGHIYNDAEDIASLVRAYKNAPEVLKQHKAQNFQLGQHWLNWDKETPRFLNMVYKALGIE